MLIAIDHGNYAVKTPHFSFISGLTEHTVKPPMAEEVLEYNGKYWSLTGQRLPYMRDKTRDDRYFILSLFAIAKELSAAGANTAFEQIDLAVGLPPEHYGMLRERFAQYFRRFGTVNFAEPAPVSVKIDGGIRREALEQMIRSIIDERIANGQLLAGGVETPSIQMQEDLNVDIAAMISNLELFDG